MKILFVGDASNYHNCLSKALSKMGHEVTVASHGSYWQNTHRDIDISRPFNGKLGGALLWLKLNTLLSSSLKGYDVVHISNPTFLNLRPNRNRELFDRLKRNNGAIFLTALSTDSYYVDMCCEPNSPLHYSEWQISGKPGPLAHKKQEWLQPELFDHCKYIYDNIDGAVTALYEYDLSARRILSSDKVAYAGIPIDCNDIAPNFIDTPPQKVKLFLGRHKDRQAEKGSDRIERAAKAVAERYPDRCQLDIVENLPYDEYLTLLRNAHVVLDQLYSFTPATNALLAMAIGQNTLSGGENEFYEFIGECDLRPVINAVPDDNALFNILENVVLNPEEIAKRSHDCRKFVEKHNDSNIVAQRFVDFWEKHIK